MISTENAEASMVVSTLYTHLICCHPNFSIVFLFFYLYFFLPLFFLGIQATLIVDVTLLLLFAQLSTNLSLSCLHFIISFERIR